MDNASIHIQDEVVEAIEAAGAKILFSAPYSPDLNPIEFMFSVCKAGLKRHSLESQMNWRRAHYYALKDVTPLKANNFFAKCGVPGVSKWEKEPDDEELELELVKHHFSTVMAVVVDLRKEKRTNRRALTQT